MWYNVCLHEVYIGVLSHQKKSIKTDTKEWNMA